MCVCLCAFVCVYLAAIQRTDPFVVVASSTHNVDDIMKYTDCIGYEIINTSLSGIGKYLPSEAGRVGDLDLGPRRRGHGSELLFLIT